MSGVPGVSQGSSDYFDDDDPGFLEALSTAVLPGDIVVDAAENENIIEDSSTSQELEPPPPAQPIKVSNSGDLEDSATSQELEPPPPAQPIKVTNSGDLEDSATSQELEPPPPAQPLKRKRSLTPLQVATPPDDIKLEPPPPAQPLKRKRSLNSLEGAPDDVDRDEIVQVNPEDDTYGAATFGAFGEYMRRKRAKLQIQNAQMPAADKTGGMEGITSQIFKGLAIYVSP